MRNSGKTNFNQALWLSVSYVCSMAVGIVSSAILSRYFGKAEYGTYKQIMYVYQILFTVFQAGLPAVFTYFLPRFGKGEGKYIVKKINILLFALGGGCSLALFASSDSLAIILKNPELAIGLKIFAIFPLFTLPTLGVEGIYTVNKNTQFIAFYNIVTRLLMLICIVVPVLCLKNDYRYALAGWGIASFIAFVIAMFAKNKVYRGVYEVKIPNMFRDVFNYTFPIMGSALVFMVFNSASQFFISRYYGTESFAEYSNGYMTLPFAAIFIAPIRMLLTPMFAKASSDGNYTNALQTLHSSSKQIFVLLIPLITFSFVYAREIMLFLYGDTYINSFIYFRIILMFNLVEMFVFSSVLTAIGRSKQHFYFDISCTIVLWCVDSVLVLFGIGNPYIITAVFTFFNALSRYVLPGIYLYGKMRLKILNCDMMLCLLTVLLHTCMTAFAVYSIMRLLSVSQQPLFFICISLLVYYLLLILTSKMVHVNYLQVLLKFRKKTI